MKKALLLFLLLPFVSVSQNTTTQSGNFYNPLIWDCLCLPANGDQLIINHDVTMNLDIYYNAGSITINSGGSLVQDATERNFWADGTGSVDNAGTFEVHAVYISPGATILNSGTMQNIDSVWNQGTFTNTGSAALYDFWNDQSGVFTNAGNLVNADSIFNQGDFTNTMTATIYDMVNDQMATFANYGDVLFTNNLNNQGYFENNLGVEIANDFSNCNIQTMDAMLVNTGTFCVSNDMTNCADDTITGIGNFYIGGSSSNFGVFDGTQTFHTPSGTIGVPGNIQPGVTITTGSCILTLEPVVDNVLSIYPNPTNNYINVSQNNVSYEVFDVAGRLMLSGMIEDNTIDFSTLNEGIYTVRVGNNLAQRVVKL